MSKHTKVMLREIHENNHPTTKLLTFTNLVLTYRYLVAENTGKLEFTGLHPGIFYMYYHDEYRCIILTEYLAEGDKVVIYDLYRTYIEYANGTRKYIGLYKFTNLEIDPSRNKYTVIDTMNDYFEYVAVNGITNLEYAEGKTVQSPEYPAKLNSISNITLTSYNEDETESDSITYRLTHNVKSLPNKAADVVYIDANNYSAVIHFRIGRLVFTGAESWQQVYELSNEAYSVFYLPMENIRLGDNNTAIQSNYFPTVTYSKIKKDEAIGDCISNSNDKDANGIYIRISTKYTGYQKHTEDTGVLKGFKEYLSNRFKENPVMVDYLLDKEYDKTILLERYRLKTFYPTTILTSDFENQLLFSYKSFEANPAPYLNFYMPILKFRV